MTTYTPDKVDTHFRVYDRDGIVDDAPETLDGTGYSEVCKASQKANILIANKTFIGQPHEDDIDVVRGGPYFFGPNDHTKSRTLGQNITFKAGAHAVIRGNFGRAVAGQYSIYDRWLRGPKTTMDFAADACGRVELWWAVMPSYVPPLVHVEVKPAWMVWGYFIFRSVVQTITGK